MSQTTIKFVLYICQYKMIQCTVDLNQDRKRFLHDLKLLKERQVSLLPQMRLKLLISFIQTDGVY
jgi:hypothetical protein